MKVYIVEEEIDLGYHVDSVYLSKEKAEEQRQLLCDLQAMDNPYYASLRNSGRSYFNIEEFEVIDG